jgi:hypothetical protein
MTDRTYDRTYTTSMFEIIVYFVTLVIVFACVYFLIQFFVGGVW